MTRIHPTAIVSPEAELDPSVEVGPYAIVEAGVVLGPDCVVGAHAHLSGNTRFGRGNRIFPFAVIGSPPQDKKYRGEEVYLEIGDDNVFREFVTVNPGTEGGGGRTTIGDRNLLMAYVHVAHDCHIGDDCVLSNAGQLAGHVVLEDRVVLGGMSGIHQFVRVGTGAMVGGGSMVTLDVPPFCIVAGNRATLQGLNLVGLQRAGVPKAAIAALKEAYRLLYRSGRPFREALAEARQRWGDEPHVQRLVAFIEASERGTVRPDRRR